MSRIFKKPCVVYFCEYDPSSDFLECSIAAKDFMFANGITHDADKSHFYVGDTYEKTITIFKRNISSNLLEIVHI
jgi:sugar lactone lactonase YvrE